MNDTYLVVGIHGAPTPETAPHGFRYQSNGEAGWWVSATINLKLADPLTRWQPLPAPPTEQAPPPEPVKRWVATWDHDGWLLRHATPDNAYSSEDATSAADALNALDRDGVAWGPGRPMSELPDDGAVLLLDDEGAFCVLPIETVRAWSVFVCWWPLPGHLPGEATT